MDFGLHLPLVSWRHQPFSLADLVGYAGRAERLGFTTLSANDHLSAALPWLDSLTAMAAVLPYTREIMLMTSVALPVLRGPVPLAKALAALDVLSGGRLIAGVGPGSSSTDYALAGVPFEERWPRFDEAARVLRHLLRRDAPAVTGQFYPHDAAALEPFPVQEPHLPIWIGSWGSEAGLRRVARLGDGWLTSAYNVTPETFAQRLAYLNTHLRAQGKDPDRFPHALSTMYLHVTDDRLAADRVLSESLGPLLSRPLDELRKQLLVGPAYESVEKLTRLAAAGVRTVLLWPVGDAVPQVEKFCADVLPLLPR